MPPTGTPTSRSRVDPGRGGVARIVAGLVLVLLLSTGCAGIEGLPSGRAASRADAGVSAAQRDWMGRLCDGLGEVVAVASRHRTVDPPLLPRAQMLLARQIREVEAALAQLAGRVERLGPPPIDEDPQRAHDEVRSLVEDRRDALRKAAVFVEGAEETGTVEVIQIARAAQSAHTAGPILINETSRVEGLEEAFAATPACRRVDPGEKGSR